MKNYLQTINDLNPNRLFTFGNYSNFLNYNGKDITGAIFDEINGELLNPVFLPLNGSPEKIAIFSPSVINNEVSNQGLIIGSNDIDNPYGIRFESDNAGTVTYGESSLSFQFRVPTQYNNGFIRIKDFERVVATVTYTNLGGEEVTTLKACVLYGRRWFIQMWGLRPLKNTWLYVSVSYKNEILYTDEFMMNSDTYITTEIPPESVPDFSTAVLKETIGDGKPSYFGCYTNNYVGGKRILYGTYTITDINTTEDINILSEKNGDLIIYGEYNEPITIRGFDRVNDTSISQDSIVDLITIGNMRIYISGLYLYAGSLNTKIDYNKNYNVTLTLSNKNTVSGAPVSTLKMYLDDIMVSSTNLQMVNGVFVYHAFSTAPLKLGKLPVIRGKNNFYVGDSVDTYFERDNTSCYIDNIATYDTILSPVIIHKLYIRTLTYRQLLLENKVTYYTEFDKLKSSYVSFNNSKEFIVHGMETKVASLSGEIYPVGVNFKGNGNLKVKNESSYNDSSTLLNYGGSFSIVIWIKTTSKDFVLFSEREKQHPNNGFSIMVDNGGRLLYEYGKQSYNSNCIVSDGRYKMVCISYNATTNEIITYIPLEYKDVGLLTPLINSFSTHRYITMFSDNNKIENIDVSLGALGFFDGVINTSFFDDMFTENISFSVTGYVAYKNLPTNAVVRVIRHDTGDLIDTLHTDSNGAFTYSSIYRNDVDLIIFGEDGYVQCLGTITAETIN